MSELQTLDAGHADPLLAFERANRAYFAQSISDRGDAWFDEFHDRLRALLAEQASGAVACYVLVGDDGSIQGRFNLYDLEDGAADVGYRVAQRVAGRGVATEALGRLCRLAAQRHGLRTLTASTSHQNVASQRVLVKAGFVPLGPADPAALGGTAGMLYRRDLADL